MKITQKLRGAMRRIAEVSLAGGAEGKRRTVPLPSILNTYGPRPDAYPKPSPANLRRFAETPVARKAINTIKDQIAGMRWRIQPRPGRGEQLPDADLHIRILTDNFDAPNPDDSFRSLTEQVLEDVIVGGFGAIEVESTGDPEHPLSLWPVDGATIRIKGDWDGLPGSPHYVQVTNRYGAQAQVPLNDDELIYIRLNPRTHTPFGLGRLEVAFETVNAFLGANRYAARISERSRILPSGRLQVESDHEWPSGCRFMIGYNMAIRYQIHVVVALCLTAFGHEIPIQETGRFRNPFALHRARCRLDSSNRHNTIQIGRWN